MTKLYLDIDGVLLTAKHTQAAPGVDEFIKFITQNFACYWLTTHCKGDSAPAFRNLSRFLKPITLERLR
jgi:ribonucleotide monophosphatase NagD (HAD superfamily)